MRVVDGTAMPLAWSQQLEQRLARHPRDPRDRSAPQEARVVGDLAPRVEVERELEACELEACEQGRVLRREVLA